ncbi:MAG: nucleotidyltransferase family protein [Phycisphaerales bacterium]|nr:nucleotidyltransferase family protein [Phycisphaerales bacterium]
MPPRQLEIPRHELEAFCRRWGIARLALFGSVLRDDFRADSDVDVLVEFLPDVHVTLFDMAEMQEELGCLFGRPVDLRTPGDLSRYFRQSVMEQAQVQYVA